MTETRRTSVRRTVYVYAEVLFEYENAKDLADPDSVEVSVSITTPKDVVVKFDPWNPPR